MSHIRCLFAWITQNQPRPCTATPGDSLTAVRVNLAWEEPICSVASHSQTLLGRLKHNMIAIRAILVSLLRYQTATLMTYSGAKPPYREDSLSKSDAINGEKLGLGDLNAYIPPISNLRKIEHRITCHARSCSPSARNAWSSGRTFIESLLIPIDATKDIALWQA
ncbi:hypothetical protein CYLTODRAFT_457280 [Cylindrobasidium torrendii FP15055 ss-10]|uniref:Uncharacterized protein n=1 Tax=Cylindrobasidium torrendii FP15055 ss-10 TaxID=1314674 RepID=A0A0D7B2G4_9AGAR|nr:hypothetical protein CYLTODRAFT_457280 [Cylindrobasidium torrendii FP15055 ss-10]